MNKPASGDYFYVLMYLFGIIFICGGIANLFGINWGMITLGFFFIAMPILYFHNSSKK